MENEIKQYVRSYYWEFIVSLISFGLSFLCLSSLALIYGFLTLFLAIFLLFDGLKTHINLNRVLNDPNTQACIFHDFQNSQVVLNGYLRLGSTYVFGKKSNTVLRYDEILQMFVHVHRINSKEDERKLRVINKNKKKIDLCSLKESKANMDELKSVAQYFLMRNPRIILGYR